MTRRVRSFIAVAIAAAVCLALAGAWLLREGDSFRGYRARAAYPRIVLVTFDTLNVWYTSLYSDDRSATPNLQALADTGVLFEQARTVVPLTLPSHTSLLSGRMPWETGVMVNGDHVPDSVETLPEILSAHGYRTAAFLSLGVLNPAFNLDQGFDHYDSVPAKELGRWYRTGDEVTRDALRWMEAREDEPFFVWIHLSDPHGPFLGEEDPPDTELTLDGKALGRFKLGRIERRAVNFELPPGNHRLQWSSLFTNPGEPFPVVELLGTFELGLWTVGERPEDGSEHELRPSWGIDLRNPTAKSASITMTFRGRLDGASNQWNRARYRVEVHRADRYLGEIRQWLESRNLEQGTLWWIASDHGEGLGHGGSYGHARFNREEQLRTLLFFGGSTIPASKRLSAPAVLLADAFPTVLDLLGVEIPSGLEGRSLVDCWRAEGCGPPRREWPSYGVSRNYRVRSSGYYRWPLKALWTRRGRSGIFDLRTDPREMDPRERLPMTYDALRGAASKLPPDEAALVEPLVRQIDVLGTLLKASEDRALDADEKAMLRSLGYL